MCAARGGVAAADGDDRPPEFITKLYRMLLVRTQCVYSVLTRPMNRARLLPRTNAQSIAPFRRTSRTTSSRGATVRGHPAITYDAEMYSSGAHRLDHHARSREARARASELLPTREIHLLPTTAEQCMNPPASRLLFLRLLRLTRANPTQFGFHKTNDLNSKYSIYSRVNFEAIVREALLDLQRVRRPTFSKVGRVRRHLKRQRVAPAGDADASTECANGSSSSNLGQAWAVNPQLMLENTKNHWNSGRGPWRLIP